jgi:hypothetical protein
MQISGTIAGYISGPAAPVLQSVFGSIAASLDRRMPDGQALALAMQQAFSGVFGQPYRFYPPACPPRPPCYGAAQIPAEVRNNPMAALPGLGDFHFLDELQEQIEHLMRSEELSDQIQTLALQGQFRMISDSIRTVLLKQRDVAARIASRLESVSPEPYLIAQVASRRPGPSLNDIMQVFRFPGFEPYE